MKKIVYLGLFISLMLYCDINPPSGGGGGGSGDMLKSTYDVNNNGIVDNSENIIDNAISTNKIQNGAITGVKIATGSITESHLSSSAKILKTNEVLTLPTIAGNAGKFLKTDGSTLLWSTSSATPGGSNQSIQYNNNGVFGGDNYFTWNGGLKQLYVYGSVGIKTTPEFELSLGDDGGIIAKGTYLSGNNLITSGAGTRLIWYPRKAAFRVGGVGGTRWDDTNIGSYSTAMGYDTLASGSYSTAMGMSTIASGSYSTAMGYYTTASGGCSTAMGYGTTASEGYSTAMGKSTLASGSYSTAMGMSTIASGWGSTAMGYYTTASSYSSLAIGRYNVGGGTADSWVSTDPLFEIGIGTDASNKANALTVLKKW